MMKIPLTYLFFVCLPFAGMCSDANQELVAREEELTSALFSSKVGVYPWMAALRTLCGRIPWLDWQAQEVWPRYRVTRAKARLQLTEGLYYLQRPCRQLYLWKTKQEDPTALSHVEKKSNNKRKSLKTPRRQFYTNTARKPYLLK